MFIEYDLKKVPASTANRKGILNGSLYEDTQSSRKSIDLINIRGLSVSTPVLKRNGDFALIFLTL
jgi:hypothetical protein